MTDSEKMERHQRYIRSLREFADFLEAHPQLQTPYCTTVNTFASSKDDLAAQARCAKWEKVYNGDWFSLRKTFGEGEFHSADIIFEINASRETVCRKVVTGTRIVPAQPERVVEEFTWECDSTLLGGENGRPTDEIRACDEESAEVSNG